MALLGTFSAAEANATTVTSGSRTSVAGSLVVAAGAAWNNSAPINLLLTSSLAGTYTVAREVDFSTNSNYALAYNIGGTRGATHTLTAGGDDFGPVSGGITVSGGEFDGIDASPTVTVGSTASGNSTAPSCTVTVPSGTATVIAVVAYDGGSTTIAVSNGTQTTEADENNDQQAHSMAHKVGQSGAVTIAWTLGAARDWSCFAVAFSEPGGGGTTNGAAAYYYSQL